MKTVQVLFTAGLLCVPVTFPIAQTAQARLYCLSLRFQQGASDAGNFTLDLSTIAPPSPPNGELAPSFDDPSHSSGFILEDRDLLISVPGVIEVDVPLRDANQNGFADFFEASQPVSETTSGRFTTPLDQGTVVATWNRVAGFKDGSCVFQLTATNGGMRPLGNFRHGFELIEYKGPLNYTPGTNRLSGTIALTQTGNPANRLGGPLELTKTPPDRFNELDLLPGAWTNAMAQSLSYTNDLFLRDQPVKTNYYGFVDFTDGDPNTPENDYFTWAMSIDDANDSDGDGIPNFSDDPGSTSIRPPALSLSRSSANLLLSISGPAGRLHEIQEVASLTRTNWNTVLSLTLTNDPQVVSLPWTSDAARFWRVRVP